MFCSTYDLHHRKWRIVCDVKKKFQNESVNTVSVSGHSHRSSLGCGIVIHPKVSQKQVRSEPEPNMLGTHQAKIYERFTWFEALESWVQYAMVQLKIPTQRRSVQNKYTMHSVLFLV